MNTVGIPKQHYRQLLFLSEIGRLNLAAGRMLNLAAESTSANWDSTPAFNDDELDFTGAY